MSAGRDRLALGGVVVLALAAAATLIKAHPPPPPGETAPDPDDDPPVASASASASASQAPAAPPPPAYVRENDEGELACGKGMLLIDGIYCPFVGHTCARFKDEAKDICAEFGPDVLCEGRLEHRRFCIDRFEYPNLEGVLPAVLVTFDEAKAACTTEEKRLCDAEEWEFACEGPGMWPYPNGRERDDKACNLDHAAPDEHAVAALLADPRALSQGLEAVDGRAASGSRFGCISPFGLRDASGNVEEWVENTGGKTHEAPYRSALKGGSWAPSRASCRPLVTSHDAGYRAIDAGFRCCKDARGTPRPKEPAKGADATRPKKSRMK